MAYRRPGITVTQEFANLAPSLALFNLPGCAVGPAYQLVSLGAAGTYSGAEQEYAYPSLLGGAIVDLEYLAADEQFPATKKPVAVKIQNTVVEIVAAQIDGSGVGSAFVDNTASQFADVLVGDVVVITPALAVSVLSAQTNGVSTDTPSGDRKKLTAGTAGQFANVKVGDSVIITAGTNTIPGTYTVVSKISSSVLALSGDINDGVGPSTNVAYSISGDRGVLNAGSYKVKTKTDDNNLVLESPLPDSPEALIRYYIKRSIGTISVARAEDLVSNAFLAESDKVTLPIGLTAPLETGDYPVIAGNVVIDYRALRNDLAAEVAEYEDISAVEAAFGGSSQIAPPNPLAYALSIMFQNTVTSVFGLGLGEEFATDEVLAYTSAADILKSSEVYSIAPLSHSPVVHLLFKNHVEQLSEPDRKLERVVLFNSLLKTTMVMQEGSTTSIALSGARTIVGTQVDGAGVVASPAVLNDATIDQFLNVEKGDSVTIVSGTNVTPGVYTVLSKQSSNQITLSAAFITAGSPSDIVYVIQRKDGLGANGITLYDRNASFISNGVAAGHYITILSGPYAERYKIATIISEKELELSIAVAGVVTLQTALEYQADRNLSKSEQADAVAGYSQSFGSRRAIHVWPDVLKAPVGQAVEKVPGFYQAVAIAALASGLPTQQGFTNLAFGGFLGFEHSTKYFSEDQLNDIADGGTFIASQDGPDQPLYCRHQLTTDRSSIKFQEFSVTKNVDFIAKFMRDSFKAYAGQFNIVDTTLDEIKTTGAANIAFLKDKTKRPKIGGVIRGGSLASLIEDPTQIDTVLAKFNLTIPIPLNYLDITISV